VVTLRLGVVSYLNAEPLVYGLAGVPGLRLVRGVPSRVADWLAAREVELGMIPAAAYPDGDYAIVPGIGIASRGPVRSVCLFHERPLERARRVALDSSSRTSVLLARILLREILGRDPEYVASAPGIEEMLADADAALVIGDPALYYRGAAQRVDLGDEWTRRTGLPFVYAFWAGLPGAADDAMVALLQRALREGQEHLAAIAASYNGLGAGQGALSESYLRDNIVYDLGDGERAGLREFYRRAHALGLIARVPELRFHGRR
jgi:predicted solute-binding protein